MKIAIIHGQNHMGSSYHIGRILLDKIDATKEVSEFFLPRDLNHFCLGCYSCIENQSRCPYHEEKKKIMDAVEEADLLIFTTPNYCMMPSAPMKAFIDLTFTWWMSHRPVAKMFSKRAVVISTTAGTGAKQATKAVARTLFYWGVPSVKKYGIAVAAMNWDGVKTEKKTKIEKDMTKLAKQLSGKRPPHVGIKTRFMFRMMAGMQKADWGASQAEKEYWKQSGWLDKERPWK